MLANWFGGFLKIFAIGKNPCLIRVLGLLYFKLICQHLPIGRYGQKKAVHKMYCFEQC
jgi:hypothetical protein